MKRWGKIKIVEKEGIQEWGRKIIELWRRRKNIKIVAEGIKKWMRENNKLVEEEENKNERERGKWNIARSVKKETLCSLTIFLSRPNFLHEGAETLTTQASVSRFH